MATESVSPLRIQKTNSGSSSLPKPSPTKMAKALSEVSPMGVRRNSPSFHHAIKNAAPKGDSSPFDASPESRSPRSFWKTRESTSPSRFGGSENIPLHSTPSQRQSSIERLQKASRVKNSNIYARVTENGFDPDSSIMSDRSFMTGRPLTGQAFLGNGNTHAQTNSAQSSPSKGHRRADSTTNIPFLSPTKTAAEHSSPLKQHLSPGKSSLSSSSRFAEAGSYSGEMAVWSDDEDAGSRTPRGTLRHPKSVSFDVGPPQINEYEQITPDPSSVASGSREGSYDDDEDEYDMDLSFERGSSEEHDDSFDHSLEDTAKTPVVLPEDWQFMSPEAANTSLADTFDDPFERNDSSPEPAARRISSRTNENGLSRSLSVTSDGEPRPLPPLPKPNSPFMAPETANAQAASAPNAQTPSAPRPASISKNDILKMQGSSMPLEERLQLLSVQNQHTGQSQSHEAAEKMDASIEEGPNKTSEDQITQHVEIKEGPYPRSTREPSLRRMKSQNFDDSEMEKYANLDPDVPIPSREASSNYEDGVAIKQEPDPTKEVIDMYALPEAQFDSRNSSPFGEDYGRESSVIHHGIPIYEDEDADQATENSQDTARPQVSTKEINDWENSELVNDENSKPQDRLNISKGQTHEQSERKMSLPEFSGFSERDSFGFGLETYMTPSPPVDDGKARSQEQVNAFEAPKLDSSLYEDATELALPPPPAPFELQDHEEVSTPDSVIRRSPFEEEKESTPEDDFVPQPKATVKAPGGRLKTRRSASTAELEALRDQQAFTSSDAPPAIPDKFRTLSNESYESEQILGDNGGTEAGDESKPRRRQSMRMTLDMPLATGSDDLGFGMDKEFDRLLEAQKRGYLMRQNTKVVVATNRNFSNEKPPSEATKEPKVPLVDLAKIQDRETRSAGNSPRKPSGPPVTTEPWNGKMRRHSTRKSIICGDKPLSPTRQSMGGIEADGLNSLSEDQQSFLEPEAGAERGRFFVKVMGVKNLDLPLPRNERTSFQLTLDNGLHCVTTAWLELGRNAPIGQEFELTVFDDLDFSLTLQTKLERPKSQASVASQASSFDSPKKKEKQSAFSRLLSSPKKRREAERKQQEEQAELARQRQREIEIQRVNAQPTAWDLLHNLVGPDGSFAQSIVSLDDHEERSFGRPVIVDVPCYNNWAVEDSFNSTKSKHGGVQRKPPYKIGSLTLQLLYIPKPKGVSDDDMPQSMSACVKQLKEAEANATRSFEGPLSQQGGDCPYWRRRFFKLNGSILTAYHESTRQRRANIRLAKATKLIDDRSALTQNDANGKGGKGRRRSAFATDTEGYMFVEEGFRICFANGDTIDFYADTRQAKEEWMDHLSNVIGKDFSADRPTWTAAVLAFEKLRADSAGVEQPPASAPVPTQARPELQEPLKSNPASPSKQAPSSKPASPAKQASPTKQTSPAKPASPTKQTSPMKPARATLGLEKPPPPIEKSPRHSLQASPQKGKGASNGRESNSRQSGSADSRLRRKAVRSMIF